MNRLQQNGDGAGFVHLARDTGNEDDSRPGIFRDDVPASGGAVELRHLVIHEHDIGMVPAIGLDGFEPGSYDFDDFVLTAADELGQGCADASLVVRDQNSHGLMMAESVVPAE